LLFITNILFREFLVIHDHKTLMRSSLLLGCPGLVGRRHRLDRFEFW
jgi:hypothetical protein